MTDVFLSIGGFSNKRIIEAINLLEPAGFKKLEISGCQYSQDFNVEYIRGKKGELLLQPHNYFSSQEKPFVLNLASQNDQIISESLQHCFFAIDLCAESGVKQYAVHAGYLLDPQVNELGKKVSKRKMMDRDLGLQTFSMNIKKLHEYAESRGVQLLIENNVLGQSNYQEFGGNPFLLVDPKEISLFLEKHLEVGLLLDVAHWKVSAQQLDLSLDSIFVSCEKYIKGYHLSDNNGFEDENKKVTSSSWFWDYLNIAVPYVTLEVYEDDMEVLRKQLLMVEEFFEKV